MKWPWVRRSMHEALLEDAERRLRTMCEVDDVQKAEMRRLERRCESQTQYTEMLQIKQADLMSRINTLEMPPLERHLAYRKVRAAPDLHTLVLAYRRVFAEGNVDAEYVLRDLMTAAGADGTTYVDGDPHRSVFNEGMRNLWLHIEFYRSLDPDQIDKPATAQMEMSDE